MDEDADAIDDAGAGAGGEAGTSGDEDDDEDDDRAWKPSPQAGVRTARTSSARTWRRMIGTRAMIAHLGSAIGRSGSRGRSASRLAGAGW